MRKEYDLNIDNFGQSCLEAIKDFLSVSSTAYTQIVDITQYTHSTEVKPYFRNGDYLYMVYRCNMYNIYVIFFSIFNHVSVLCSSDYDKEKEIWYQKNVHYNGYKEFLSDLSEDDSTHNENFIYYIPSPTFIPANKLVCNYNSFKNSIMFSAIKTFEYPNIVSTVSHTENYTRNILLGGYLKYSKHIGGFYYGGDYVYTYELIHRSGKSITILNDMDIGTLWQPSTLYKVGNIVKTEDYKTTRVFYRCILEHTSAKDSIYRDVKSNVPKWESFQLPFYAHNLNYLYSYIDYVWDSKFLSPEWHTKTSYFHSNDEERIWIDTPRNSNDSLSYSYYIPNSNNNTKLDMFVNAYIDSFADTTVEVGKHAYLSSTDSPISNGEIIEQTNKEIEAKEAEIDAKEAEIADLEAQKKERVANDPMLSFLTQLFGVFPRYALYETDNLKYESAGSLRIDSIMCSALAAKRTRPSNGETIAIKQYAKNWYSFYSSIDEKTIDSIIKALNDLKSHPAYTNLANLYVTTTYSPNVYVTVSLKYLYDMIYKYISDTRFSYCIELANLFVGLDSYPFDDKEWTNKFDSLYTSQTSYNDTFPNYNNPSNASYNNKGYDFQNTGRYLLDGYYNEYKSIVGELDKEIAELNKQLAQLQKELDELKEKPLSLITIGDRLPLIEETAIWCSTTQLGNCVPLKLSIDNDSVYLPNYSPLVSRYCNKHGMTVNTLNNISLIMPLWFMTKRQPVIEDTWSAIGHTSIINYVDMYNMSTNKMKNGNYPVDTNEYNCFCIGLRRNNFGMLGYPGIAFKMTEEVEPDVIKYSIMDIDAMNTDRLGGEVILNIVNTTTGISAYGGKTLFNKYDEGSILLKNTYKYYEYIEVHYTDLTGSYDRYIIWDKHLLENMLIKTNIFDLLRHNADGCTWYINPTKSTDTLLSGSSQNCGLISIKGYEV